jgi:RNA polymerase sigma-70 factor (ECF subfamily)
VAPAKVRLASVLDARTTILLRRWHQGDAGALGSLLEEHLGWITQHVRARLGRVLRRKAETVDYVEETILELLDHGPRFVIANGKHFRALVARIAENVLSGNHRWWTAARRAIDRECPIPRDSILVLDPEHAPQGSPSAAAEHAEREALVRLGLELLRPDQREIIVLRDYQHLALSDIAQRLGTKAGTAQKRYERALQALARTVGALRSRRLEELLSDRDTADPWVAPESP